MDYDDAEEMQGDVEEWTEELGQVIGRCDNFLGASQLPASPEIHLKGMTGGLKSIRADLLALYRKMGGEEFEGE